MSGTKKRWIGFVLGFAAVALVAALLMSRRDAPAPVEAAAHDIAQAGRRPTLPPMPPVRQPELAPRAEGLTSSDARAAWSKVMRELGQQTPAQLVHRAAVSKQPQDVFAAHVLMHQCRKGASPAMVAHAAPSASEQMKRTISQLQERCSQSGNRQQLDYAAQSWPADAPERKGFEAIKRVDKVGVVNYVLSTGSADFAARLLPAYIDLELLQARGLLPPLAPEAEDLQGMGPDFDLPSVSRMRDRFAVSWAVAIWSCTRLGTCVEEAQLDFKCHLLSRCVDDLRDYPAQVLFRQGPLEPNGTPSYFWVSRTRWAQIERAVDQLLADLN